MEQLDAALVRRRLAARLSTNQVAYVMATASKRGIGTAVLWAFLERFGSAALLMTLASGHGRDDVLRLAAGEAAYDETGTAVLARLAEPRLFALAATSRD